MQTLRRSRVAYQGWAKVLQLDLADETGQPVRREVVDTGEAVAVLPYDAERGVAMLVRQQRAPLLLGGGDGLLLEAPAGRVEVEGPEACARREALEECGLRLGELVGVGAFWSMPGVSTERLHLFLAAYAAADRIEAGGGLATEHEQIEVIETPLPTLWRQWAAGELADMKTALLLHALKDRRPDLFA